MNLFWELAGSLPFTLGVIAVALLVLLFEIGRRLALAAELANHTVDDAAKLEAASENGDLAVMDLRTSGSVAPLRRSFNRVGKLLQRMLPGNRPRYQTPWFLSLGPTAAGKTTLLEHSRLVLPLGEPNGSDGTAPPGCNWWLFDRAVTLDVSGNFVLQAQGTTSDATAWRGLLDLLRRHRHRRPADGVLLTLPASDLLDFKADDPEIGNALADRASVLRRKLAGAQERLGMRLPVYVVVTKCDLVPGFEAFVERLTEDERRQIFGWSNPDPPEAPYAGGWIDTAFASVDYALARFQLRTLGGVPSSSADGYGNRELVAFPAALGRLKDPLRITCNQIFSASASTEPFPFRGLYFCGGSGFGTQSADSPHQMPGSEALGSEALPSGWSEPTPNTLPSNAHRRVSFVADLFDGKVLYEWNLAQPTAKARQSAGRRATVLRAMLFACLLLGPLALWGGLQTSSTRAATLDQKLLEPIIGTLQPTETADQTTAQPAERARLALEAAGRIPNYSLQTALLPWGVTTDRHLTQAMTDLYRDTVFPTTRENMDSQLAKLATVPAPRPVIGSLLGVESIPEFQTLRARTGRLRELELDVSRYNCFSPSPCGVVATSRLDNFHRMIESVYRTQLSFPTRSARDFYADLLSDVSVAPYADAGHRPGLQARTLAMSDAMFDRLFTENALTLDLDDLTSQINALTGQAPTLSDIRQAFEQLRSTLERTRDDLGRPELAWAGSDKLQLGDDFKSWIDAVRTSRLLGPETAIEILRRGTGEARRSPRTGFAAFRYRLQQANEKTATALGPLLAAEGGVTLLQLSPEMEKLETALDSLLSQGFMASVSGLTLTLEPPPGKTLFWKQQPLLEAVALTEQFTTFTEKGLADFEALRQVTESAARESLEPLLLGHIARAQELQDLPDLFTNALRESHIVEQVANLQSVSDSLNQLLSAFKAPPAAALAGDCAGFCSSRSATGWCLFAEILETQQRDLMEQLDTLLTDRAFYTPQGGDFSWWEGVGDLSLKAFGVGTEDDLKTYLAGQQRQVKNLTEQYAKPILTGLGTRDCMGFGDGREFRRFRVILSDLSDVVSQTPNNSVAQLEEFVSTGMASLNADNCLTEIDTRRTCFSSSTPVELQIREPCDYFLDSRTRLASDISTRCDELTVEKAQKAWGEIARAFNDRLLGKFPFTDEPSQPLKQEATDDDVVNFFQAFDQHRPIVESFLGITERWSGQSPPPWDPDAVAAVRRFMSQMGDETTGVRTFMAPFLTARAASPAATPLFDLQVQFRVNQDNEFRGNQIFSWSLNIDGTEIDPGKIDPPGRWTYKQPIRLSLTWAANAPTHPLAPGASNARVDGKTVVYEYTQAWSLVSLLKQHLAPRENLTNAVDTDPVTLAFEIPGINVDPSVAEPASEAEGSAPRFLFWRLNKKNEDPEITPPAPKVILPDFTARAFVRITLLTPDDAKAGVPFPTFPTSAPVFP